MNENERPALGSPEAAVRSIVNLISLATHTDEDKLAYWLDAYYQAREAYERDSWQLDYDVVMRELSKGGPSRTPAPTEEPEDGRQIVVPEEEPEAEEPTPVMRGRETIKMQERVKNESRSESVRKQKAAERSYKMKVADRLRELRAQGVKTGDIVRISGGNVTDSAVLSILDGQFRPIADYRALDAALEKCAAEIEKGDTRT